VIILPTGRDGVQAREGVTVDWADVDVLELSVLVVGEDSGVEVVSGEDVDVLVSTVDDPAVRDVSLVVEEASLALDEGSDVIDELAESVLDDEEERSVLIVLEGTDEVEDVLDTLEVEDDELETAGRLVYTDKRLPAPQYWKRLPLHGLLHSDWAAGMDPAPKALPQ
jgi:hypothetical protein